MASGSTKEAGKDISSTPQGVKIKYGNREALLFPSKLSKQGKSISKYNKYGAKWVTPSEFVGWFTCTQVEAEH